MSSGPFEIGIFSYWGIFPIPIGKVICHKFKQSCIPFCYCIFLKLGVRLQLTSFEKEVLDYLCIPLHPCSWGYVRVFQLLNTRENGFIFPISLFHIFEVNPLPKDVVDHRLVSLRRVKTSPSRSTSTSRSISRTVKLNAWIEGDDSCPFKIYLKVLNVNGSLTTPLTRLIGI